MFYACEDQYTREDIEKAAKMAHAMDFIQKLDNGLDTEIGENGVLLSRVVSVNVLPLQGYLLLRDARLFLSVDEATSGIRYQSQSGNSKPHLMNCKNRTSLVIAHRLSTIEKADEIFSD